MVDFTVHIFRFRTRARLGVSPGGDRRLLLKWIHGESNSDLDAANVASSRLDDEPIRQVLFRTVCERILVLVELAPAVTRAWELNLTSPGWWI